MLQRELADRYENLADLRRGSLSFILLLSAAICAAWFVVGTLSHFIQPYPPGFWVAWLVLLGSTFLSHMLKSRFLQPAVQVLVWGVWGAAVALIVAFPSPATLGLLVLPIIFASTLLGPLSLFVVAGASALCALVVSLARAHVFSLLASEPWPESTADVVYRLLSGAVLIPLIVIGLTAVASWVASRDLYTALVWVWQGYDRARRNEQMARNHQAELKRVLKSLDNTLYQLERTNYKLALARNQAEEARRLKQQFVQTISHELRTPLNLIVGFTEMMAHSPEHYGGQLPVAYLRDLSIVYRNASHLQNLVNDVLDLARIETAQMTIVPEETDPGLLVREAVETIRSLVEAAGLTLCTTIEPDLPCLWIDPTRIRQVLFNLLSNAARFTDRGGITVRVHRERTQIIFAVADTGPGIAPQDLTRIFEEFQQLDGSTRRRHGGAGLGLAISQRFVRLHGGRIWVESQPGVGSTFYFSLPLAAIDLPQGLHSLPHEKKRINAGVAGEERILLVVTRSALALALLTRYIQGAHTVVAHDLEQAGQMVSRLMPQTVVIDRAVAPDLTDPEGLGRAWGLRRTPLLVCPLPGETSLRQQLAVDGYLIKPVSRPRLLDTLRAFEHEIDRILIVDDDQDFVLLMSRMLEDNPARPYQVKGAGSGAEGLALMRQNPPDLLFMDLVLPDGNGADLIDRIRANPAWRHIPIVIVSAQDELNSQETLAGSIKVAKPQGLELGEVVRWVQNTLDTATQRPVLPDEMGM